MKDASITATASILVLGLTAIAGTASADQPRIMCTNSVLADFTANLVDGSAEVDYIMPAGECPSHFDTSPGDVYRIANADVVISLGWEPWLDDLLVAAENEDVSTEEALSISE